MLSMRSMHREIPPCPVFGECGGCQYQDISYPKELEIKEQYLRALFTERLPVPEKIFEPILASPKIYHYRNRLDLKLQRMRQGGVLVGFSPEGKNGILPVDGCPIAMKEISDFVPRLKEEAAAKLTAKHNIANLVVRTGDNGRISWGGIGRRSLKKDPGEYLWTEIKDLRIYYSLETFFQANLSILPEVIGYIHSLNLGGSDVSFWDLYGGAGLFGICLAGSVQEVFFIEEVGPSVNMARYNALYNKISNMTIVTGRVEETLPGLLKDKTGRAAAMVDPPRAGLSASARETVADAFFEKVLYLSCSPESLIEDLKFFAERKWKIVKICPMDFFPRTKHLETLVLLYRVS